MWGARNVWTATLRRQTVSVGAANAVETTTRVGVTSAGAGGHECPAPETATRTNARAWAIVIEEAHVRQFNRDLLRRSADIAPAMRRAS